MVVSLRLSRAPACPAPPGRPPPAPPPRAAGARSARCPRWPPGTRSSCRTTHLPSLPPFRGLESGRDATLRWRCTRPGLQVTSSWRLPPQPCSVGRMNEPAPSPVSGGVVQHHRITGLDHLYQVPSVPRLGVVGLTRLPSRPGGIRRSDFPGEKYGTAGSSTPGDRSRRESAAQSSQRRRAGCESSDHWRRHFFASFLRRRSCSAASCPRRKRPGWPRGCRFRQPGYRGGGVVRFPQDGPDVLG